MPCRDLSSAIRIASACVDGAPPAAVYAGRASACLGMEQAARPLCVFNDASVRFSTLYADAIHDANDAQSAPSDAVTDAVSNSSPSMDFTG